eukprot:scaffold6747_cov70-Cylindrotheca_fusiformis.AAC.2
MRLELRPSSWDAAVISFQNAAGEKESCQEQLDTRGQGGRKPKRHQINHQDYKKRSFNSPSQSSYGGEKRSLTVLSCTGLNVHARTVSMLTMVRWGAVIMPRNMIQYHQQ